MEILDRSACAPTFRPGGGRPIRGISAKFCCSAAARAIPVRRPWRHGGFAARGRACVSGNARCVYPILAGKLLEPVVFPLPDDGKGYGPEAVQAVIDGTAPVRTLNTGSAVPPPGGSI